MLLSAIPSLVWVQGLQQTVVFCGDGINDLTALSAADVGFAIGASDASVAAHICTQNTSVSGAALLLPIDTLRTVVGPSSCKPLNDSQCLPSSCAVLLEINHKLTAPFALPVVVSAELQLYIAQCCATMGQTLGASAHVASQSYDPYAFEKQSLSVQCTAC